MYLDETLVNEMVDMRKNGCTYVEIEAALKVSRWSTMKYLKDVDTNYKPCHPWKEIEDKAVPFLVNCGFDDIVNLNKISGQTSTWDYYATKNKQKYLFDVTIDNKKPLIKKIQSLDCDYIGIILYYDMVKKEYISYTLVKTDLS